MRVLITGATGTIGTAVTERLLDRGDDVTGLTRDPERAREREPRVRWHDWEPEAEQPPAAALDGIDTVVNLAGEPINQRWSAAAKRRIRASRIVATRNLVAAMSAVPQPPRALISGSAVGYYGDRGDEELREESGAGEGFLAGVVKEWEREAARAAKAGVRVVSIRTAVVLAPRGGALQRMLTPFRLGAGGRLGSGRQWMPWITLEDEVRAIEWVLTHQELSGPVNLAAPRPVTNRELTKALARQLHRPAVFPVPGFALRIVLGEMAKELLLQSQREVPSKLTRSGFHFKHETIEEALAAVLGSRPSGQTPATSKA